jgi:hypothetical protein
VTRCSCIASSSADCVFGGVRLISSASTMLAKIGPARTPSAAAGRRVFLHEVGAGDVRRHQVGRELDARELQLQHLRHACGSAASWPARRADDQAVAADEQRVQHLVDDVFLADDDLAQLAENLLAARLHPVRKLDVVRRIEIDDVAGMYGFIVTRSLIWHLRGF